MKNNKMMCFICKKIIDKDDIKMILSPDNITPVPVCKNHIGVKEEKEVIHG